MPDNIFLFSAPVRSGKTTCLMNFIHNTELSVKGILSPDVEDKRVFFDIESRACFDFETEVSSSSTISIGRFHFLKDAFLRAQHIITDACDPSHSNLDWLIIDEAGKLEVEQNTGLEPAILRAVEAFKSGKVKGKLLLVVRDNLLQPCVEKYGLTDPISEKHDFLCKSIYHNILQNEKIRGLIMCGGQSSRMKSDKSLLIYTRKPQRYVLYDQLKSLFGNAMLSVNPTQSEDIAVGYDFVIDDPSFANSGPIAGLLTAMEKFPGISFITVGCDYPFLTNEHFKFFVRALSDISRPACFFHPFNQMEEPLLAYYPDSSYPDLKNRFTSGNYSLRKFLSEKKALKVIPWNVGDIKSIDSREDFEAASLKLKSFLS